ncbi:MAG TPA: LysR family transcriptional regulator [Cellvibrio sp.]|nr:LysR family transcriptional regulator [Cellvibrio sp.]
MLSIDALIGFVSVIDSGSFSAAAQQLGQTPSGVSRSISRLEAQLGITLMKRTTRRLDLTEEGEWLLARARKILADLQDTEEQLVARLSQPSGLVRINSSTPALDHLIAPLVADFMDSYPLLRLELVSGETFVDLIEERVDVAVRIGPLSDSTLNARLLAKSGLQLLASPQYLARYGKPADIHELMQHRLLGFTSPASLNIWPLAQEHGEGLSIVPVIAVSSGETLRHLALAGAGIACLGNFLSREDVASGRLVPVLESLTLPWTQPIWAVFYKQKALAPRVKVFVDFLAKKIAKDML